MKAGDANLTGVLGALREPFPVSQVRKNPQGLDYVSIDGYLNRLLDVLGFDFDFTITQSSVELLPDTMKTNSGKMQYLAQVTGQLSIGGATRAGTGADVSFDADKAIKTAQAEAIKKACHAFGIALELWDEEHRAKLARQRSITTEAGVKREVWKIARDRTGKDKPSLKEVAAVFNREASELNDVDTLRTILVEEGVL